MFSAVRVNLLEGCCKVKLSFSHGVLYQRFSTLYRPWVIFVLYIQVGDKVVPLDEITDEMVAEMTKAEKERYTVVWQKAYSQDDDF